MTKKISNKTGWGNTEKWPSVLSLGQGIICKQFRQED